MRKSAGCWESCCGRNSDKLDLSKCAAYSGSNKERTNKEHGKMRLGAEEIKRKSQSQDDGGGRKGCCGSSRSKWAMLSKRGGRFGWIHASKLQDMHGHWH